MRKSIKFIFVLVITSVVLIVGYFLYNVVVLYDWAKTEEVEMIGKTHVYFNVSAGQIIDYEDFLFPDENSNALTLISRYDREKISDYMKNNNLKLQEGKHLISKSGETYEDYISHYLKFEEMDE